MHLVWLELNLLMLKIKKKKPLLLQKHLLYDFEPKVCKIHEDKTKN